MNRYIPNTNIHTANFIKTDIIQHIDKQEPFSLIRIGDGDLKFIRCKIILDEMGYKDNEGIKLPDCVWKGYQQGVTIDKFNYVWDMYRDTSNRANYISSFDLYKKRKKGATKNLLNQWKNYYKALGVTNNSYCDPDIGFLLFDNKRIFKYIKKNNKKMCIVTSLNDNFEIFRKAGYNLSIVKIPPGNKVRNKSGRKSFIKNIPKEQWHINKHQETIEKIKQETKKSDVFFIAGGMLGRAYTDTVKECGKVGIDIGKMVNYWSTGRIPSRFNRKGNKIYKSSEITINAGKSRQIEIE